MFRFQCIFVVVVFFQIVGTLSTAAQDVTLETEETLTETYTIASGEISLTYPTGWIANKTDCTGDTFYLWLANTKSASEGFLGTRDIFNSDDVVVFISVVKKLRVLSNPINVALPRKMDMVSLLHTWKPPLLFEHQNADFSETAFEQKPAAQVWFRVPNYVDGHALMFELDSETLGLVALYTFPGKSMEWASTESAIAQSLSYIPITHPSPETIAGNPLTLSENYTSQNQLVAFRLPTGWTTQSRINNPYRQLDAEVIGIANKDSYVADHYPNDIAKDAVNITIAVDHLYELIPRQNIREDLSFLEIAQMLMAVDSYVLGFRCYQIVAQGEIKINTHSAMQINGTNEKVDTVLFIIDYGSGVYGIVKAIAPKGELVQWLPTVFSIAESVTYSG